MPNAPFLKRTNAKYQQEQTPPKKKGAAGGGAKAGNGKPAESEEAEAAHVFKVAMKPGKPQVFGLFDGRPFFGLPGNPAAAIVSFEVFARPGLRKLQGCSRILPELFEVRFPFEQRYKPGRVFLLRTRVEPAADGGYEVVRPGEQDSSFLKTLNECLRSVHKGHDDAAQPGDNASPGGGGGAASPPLRTERSTAASRVPTAVPPAGGVGAGESAPPTPPPPPTGGNSWLSNKTFNRLLLLISCKLKQPIASERIYNFTGETVVEDSIEIHVVTVHEEVANIPIYEAFRLYVCSSGENRVRPS